MASNQVGVPSRQDRQAARLRGAGTAKVGNLGFRIQGGPSIRQRTPRQTPPARTPASRKRPTLEDLLPAPDVRRSATKTPMGPPPKSTAKVQPAAKGPPTRRQTTASPPQPESSVTPAPSKPRGRKSIQPLPASLPPPPEDFSPPAPTPELPSPPRPAKRKQPIQPSQPAKRPRRSLPQLPSSPIPSIASSPSASVVSSPSASPSASPEPTSKRRKRNTDDEPGTIELRVHKLPPAQGGTRTLNEIDGLLQIVTEVLARGTQQIAQRDATQAKILDAFTEEVTIRLIEMTDVWDANAVLLGAVKRAQRRKGQLRGELIAVRREREGIRAEMEGVRRGHEMGAREMREVKRQQDFISEMEDIKAKVSGVDEEDRVKNGVEASLIELRPLVAGKSGIAGRLASFNRFLERFDNALKNLVP